MAKVNGLKEKLHMPLYDAFFVKNNTKFVDAMTDSRVLRFFVDVQNKTRLETNLQAAGVLPSQNSYEAHALRVVVADQRRAPTDTKGPVPTEVAFLSELIYNSVTSLLVGEKVMIEVPTFWFPSGSGVSNPASNIVGHGQPDPTATFRFSEPVTMEPQQNFRVEMSFPQGLSDSFLGATGPLRIWVVLDGYLTRDVQ